EDRERDLQLGQRDAECRRHRLREERPHVLRARDEDHADDAEQQLDPSRNHGATGSGTAAPSLRGSEAPWFTPVASSRITACPPPTRLEKAPRRSISWPFCSRSRSTASGMRDSATTSLPVNVSFVTRAASSAAWMFMPWSTTLLTNWACACDWFQPPMIPNAMRTPPLAMKPGMIVCSGRLRGARALACAGSRLKRLPRLCSTKPAPSGTRPDPKFA